MFSFPQNRSSFSFGDLFLLKCWNTPTIYKGQKLIMKARTMISVITIAVCGSSSLALAEDLAAYWSFNDADGSDVAYDSSGNGYHADVAGNAEWVRGQVGGALRCDGTTRLSVANFTEPILLQGSEDAAFSITAWVKPAGPQDGYDRFIVARSGKHGGLLAHSRDGTNSLGFCAYSSESRSTRVNTPAIDDFSVWLHLAVVYDQRSIVFYLNGKPIKRATFKGQFLNYGNALGIAGVEGYCFKGDIDEIRIYRSALNQEQVKKQFHDNSIVETQNVTSPPIPKISLEPNRPVLAKPLFDKKYVMAHWMGINPMGSPDRFDYSAYRPDGVASNVGGACLFYSPMTSWLDKSTEEFAALELTAAKRIGIDGFCKFISIDTCDARGHDGWDRQTKKIVTYLREAEKMKLDFKFALCLTLPKMTLPTTDEVKLRIWASRLRALMHEVNDSPNWLRTPDGRIVFFTWAPERMSTSARSAAGLFGKPDVEAEVRKLAESYEKLMQLSGIEAAIVWDVFSSVHMRTATKADLNEQFRRYVDAVNTYFPGVEGSIGGGAPRVKQTDSDWNYWASQCKSRDRSYGQSIVNDMFCSKASTLDRKGGNILSIAQFQKANLDDMSRAYYPFSGASNYRTLWEDAIRNDVPFVMHYTWDDFLEGHHMAPEINHNFAFATLLDYYKRIWRTGDTSVSKDVALAFYKKYPSTAVPSHFNVSLYISPINLPKEYHPQYVRAQDIIDVVTILTAPAELFVNGKKRCEAPKGIHSIQIPMEIGPVHIEVRRKGITVVDLTPPEWITDKPYRTDRFTYAYSSECENIYKELFGHTPAVISDEYAQDEDGIPNWYKRYKLKRPPVVE